MTTPTIAASFAAAPASRINRIETNRAPVPQARRKSLVMRKYHIASLKSDGSVKMSENIGPALPVFESAFSAFARGTLIETTHGPVAVEDLVPGMKIVTGERGASPLLWIGSMTLVPNAAGIDPHNLRLTRIMAEAFGMGRPMSDFLAGPGARILSRPSGMGGVFGGERLLIPARNMVDDVNVISITPPRPVTVYHMCLHRHATVSADGLEVETFHPGTGFERTMGEKMLSLFLSFFPHISQPKDFGSLTHQRKPLVSSNGLEVA